MILDAELVLEKAKKIKVFLMDCDGVLTDGKITYDSLGNEIKSFNVRDGHGLKLLSKNGIETGILTGRCSPIVDKRAKELSINYVWQSAKDKKSVIEDFIAKGVFKPEEIAYIGDDIVDLPVFKRVGFRITTPDAPYYLREHVDYVTLNQAGNGAVREVCEIILKAKGVWDSILKKYLE